MFRRPRTSLRAAWWSFWLPLILLLSQQGALLHELGHALGQVPAEALATASTRADSDRTGGSDSDTPQPGSAAHAVCALCLGFDHLAHAVVGAPAPALLTTASHSWALAEAPAWRAADSPTARSRGPPTRL